jgi:uncharacterized membrane protein
LIEGVWTIFEIYVFFSIPGFVWSYVFFEKGKIDLLERALLSFGLGLVLTTLSSFLLNVSLGLWVNFTNIITIAIGLTGLALMIIFVKRKSFRKWGKENESFNSHDRVP